MAVHHEETPNAMLEEIVDNELEQVSTPDKKATGPGIIYLSSIPKFMSVKKVKQIFEHYGELDRVFLQPDEKAVGTKKGRVFTEGWVEYLDKRVAKRVALSLNNSPIGGRRHSQWHDQIWNVKYLNRFKWTHLNERLAYEKAVHQQRLRTEIAQVKRETNFHIQNVEKSERLKKKAAKQKVKVKPNKNESESGTIKQEPFRKPLEIRQRLTEDEIVSKKRKIDTDKTVTPKFTKKQTAQRLSKKSFLKNIFSGGLNAEED